MNNKKIMEIRMNVWKTSWGLVGGEPILPRVERASTFVLVSSFSNGIRGGKDQSSEKNYAAVHFWSFLGVTKI